MITVIVVAIILLRAYVLTTAPKTSRVATHEELLQQIYNLEK